MNLETRETDIVQFSGFLSTKENYMYYADRGVTYNTIFYLLLNTILHLVIKYSVHLTSMHRIPKSTLSITFLRNVNKLFLRQEKERRPIPTTQVFSTFIWISTPHFKEWFNRPDPQSVCFHQWFIDNSLQFLP